MAVKGHEAQTVAQENQVPPEIRRFARERCVGVNEIRRYDPRNEGCGRGWVIYATGVVRTKFIPADYEPRNVRPMHDGRVKVQIRESPHQ